MPIIYLKAYLESILTPKKLKKLRAIDATASPGNKTL